MHPPHLDKPIAGAFRLAVVVRRFSNNLDRLVVVHMVPQPVRGQNHEVVLRRVDVVDRYLTRKNGQTFRRPRVGGTIIYGAEMTTETDFLSNLRPASTAPASPLTLHWYLLSHLRLCGDVGRGVGGWQIPTRRPVRAFLPVELGVLEVRIPERPGGLGGKGRGKDRMEKGTIAECEMGYGG